ncbi:hypothetical protein BOX15_Mlig013782g3, partial [Macrostomum lignano]
ANVMGPRAGTKEFIEGLKKRKFAKCQDVVVTAKGHELADLIDKTSFRQPFLVPSPEGLDLVVPPGSFTIRDVVDSVGKDRLVDVIDVQEQHDFKMSMADFFNWFYQEDRGNKIYNVLSLEISETRLSSTVVPPKPVRDLSLVNRCWPDESGHLSGEDCPEDDTRNKPEVLKFCLMSAGHSYTDFHIDFGGSSVWYHILWGEKIFYLIPPSDVNLDRYESWMESPDNLTEFLGDRCPGQVYQLRVTTGNTIVLPSGWIHAVYTPMDSLVFGGNFLHLHSVEMQIRIHEMEQRLATERRFQFPMFEKLHWYAAQLFLEQYQGDLDDQALPEFSHVESMRYLVQALARWYDKRRGSPYQAEYVPDNLTLPPRVLLRDFDRLIGQFYRVHCRRRGDSAGGKGAGNGGPKGGGIKLKIKRQPESKGSRKIVKHVIEQVDSITASSPKRNFDQRDSSATSSKQLHKYKKKPGKGLTAKKPNESSTAGKRRKTLSSSNNLVGINEGDSSASDEGIDVAKCTEDEQFYYPTVEDSDEARGSDKNWKPKSHSDKAKLREMRHPEQQQKQYATTKPKSVASSHHNHQPSTAKQRLGKKLGLFKSSR